jgi:hypothetical protein
MDHHQKQIEKLMQASAHRYRLHEIFRDFCELSALAISNSVDLVNYEEREARYLQIVKRYEPDEVARFPQMLAALTRSIGEGFKDCLGELFMQMELSNQWKGQFFTPYELSAMMARLSLCDDLDDKIKERGFVTVNDPATGAGCMVIGMAEAIKERGLNYQKVMHVMAQDVDSTAVHMAYIQLSLYGIPAIVIHGNTLSGETWGNWRTPMHVLGWWDSKLTRSPQEAEAIEAEPEPEPEIIAPKEVEQLALF